MVFGHLRTSTNYNKNEKRIVGGKNGFGFKLVLIWSTYGRVETVDHTRGLKYIQEFHQNLDKIDPPKITKVATTAKSYTKVTFRPDYRRFGINGITPDMLALLKKRIYDISAITDHSIKKVKVSFNNVQVPVKNFQQYIDTYIGSKAGALGMDSNDARKARRAEKEMNTVPLAERVSKNKSSQRRGTGEGPRTIKSSKGFVKELTFFPKEKEKSKKSKR